MGLIVEPRRPDWRGRLSAYLVKADTVRWGRNPCCSFMVGAVEAMTGERPVKGLRRSMPDARVSEKLSELGVSDWTEALADRSVDPSEMRVGDLAAVLDDEGQLGGAVCIGAHLKVIDLSGRIGLCPRSAAVLGYSI